VELIQKQKIETKKNKCVHAIEEVKYPNKECGFPTGMLKGPLTKWGNKR
jgi:hypothetical protein